MASLPQKFGAGIALTEGGSWNAFGARSRRNAFVCMVADGNCSQCGDLHRSPQPKDSELACVSFFWMRGRGFYFAARLAWLGTEFERSGSWAADLRVSFLDGWNGRRRREVLRSNWSMDWPIPNGFGAGDDWTCRRIDGAGIAAWGGFLKELFQHTGDLVFSAQDRGEAVLSNPRRRKMPYAPAIAIGTLISFFAR